MGESISDKVRTIVTRLVAGDGAAESDLMPLVYDELRQAAERILGSRAGQTLQPTVLVHEAWLKLCRVEDDAWEGRAHFAAVACKAMRQVLLNHARDRVAQKRGGGGGGRVTIDRVLDEVRAEQVDVLVLDDALNQLRARSERQAKIVELRVFGGLTIDEVAGALDLGQTTVKAEWRFARAWLKQQFAATSSDA
ncbi:MAG: ECF-type sigma factor [bacterium]|nr:ECF-type sigma factor [bacterium]